MKPTLLILAAGMGSRYGGLKQLDQVGPSGETLMDYAVYDAIQGGFGKVVFVIRKDFENEFKERFIHPLSDKIAVDYVFQEMHVQIDGVEGVIERKKPWGTAHAVLAAKDAIKEPFAVINADDFYGREAFKEMADFLQKTNNQSKDYSLMGYVLENTLSENGSVSRGVCEADENQNLVSVVERTKIQKEGNKIYFADEKGDMQEISGKRLVSMNFWGFAPSVFEDSEKMFQDFVKANLDNEKAEFFIPLVIENMLKKGDTTVKVLQSNAQWLGVTYREDKPDVVQKFEKMVKDGVYPNSLWQ